MKSKTSRRKTRMEVRNLLETSFKEEIENDLREGLSAPRKSIPSKYFYDTRGSRLFERICLLSEYYQTRTELSLLNKHSSRIMTSFEEGDLVELGSGANWKIRRLLDAVEEPEQAKIRYVPVDVSEAALVSASDELLQLYSTLEVLGFVADFTKQMGVISTGRSKLILFLGSTIGNLSPEECRYFLQKVAAVMEPDDRCLIGLDMIKEKETLEDAYNDSLGVTSQFNKNILNVVNRELQGDFNLSHFDHLAFFNEEEEQVEMHLRANRRTTAEIRDLPLTVELEKGETIQTEICRKFERKSAERMFSRAGLEVTNWFTDPRAWFALSELVPSGA